MEQEIRFTPLELKIYQYIIANPQQVIKFSLRRLAMKLDVSPSSVVRTLKRMGYQHYDDLCEQLKNNIKDSANIDDITYQAQWYFNQPLSELYNKKLDHFKELAANCSDFVFIGIGTSGYLAEYGARQFGNNGKSAFVLSDPGYPVQFGKTSFENRVLIALSVSGETKGIINQIINFRARGAKIVTITNDPSNTMASLSDLNFYYLLESKVIGYKINITSQIPVIYLLERLSRTLN